MRIALCILMGILTCTIKAQTGDTLADLNPSYFNQDFKHYNQKTALYLAQLSELVYSPNKNKFENFISRYKKAYNTYPLATMFIEDRHSPGTNTRVLFWAINNCLIIIFRGTEMNIGNIISDIKYKNYDDRTPELKKYYSNLPPGHAGFRNAIRRLIDAKNIFNTLDSFIKITYPKLQKNEIPVYLTGHSLGGALATLFAEPLRFNGYNVQGMYLFAPALAISCDVLDSMNIKFPNTYNIVNYKDYIPRAGLRGTLAHFGRFFRICDDATLSEEPERYIQMNASEKKNILKYHRLASYVSALRLDINNDSNVANRHSDCFSSMNVDPLCR